MPDDPLRCPNCDGALDPIFGVCKGCGRVTCEAVLGGQQFPFISDPKARVYRRLPHRIVERPSQDYEIIVSPETPERMLVVSHRDEYICVHCLAAKENTYIARQEWLFEHGVGGFFIQAVAGDFREPETGADMAGGIAGSFVPVVPNIRDIIADGHNMYCHKVSVWRGLGGIAFNIVALIPFVKPAAKLIGLAKTAKAASVMAGSEAKILVQAEHALQLADGSGMAGGIAEFTQKLAAEVRDLIKARGTMVDPEALKRLETQIDECVKAAAAAQDKVSKASVDLSKCETMEQAFAEMEKLKQGNLGLGPLSGRLNELLEYRSILQNEKVKKIFALDKDPNPEVLKKFFSNAGAGASEAEALSIIPTDIGYMTEAEGKIVTQLKRQSKYVTILSQSEIDRELTRLKALADTDLPALTKTLEDAGLKKGSQIDQIVNNIRNGVVRNEVMGRLLNAAKRSPLEQFREPVKQWVELPPALVEKLKSEYEMFGELSGECIKSRKLKEPIIARLSLRTIPENTKMFEERLKPVFQRINREIQEVAEAERAKYRIGMVELKGETAIAAAESVGIKTGGVIVHGSSPLGGDGLPIAPSVGAVGDEPGKCTCCNCCNLVSLNPFRSPLFPCSGGAEHLWIEEEPFNVFDPLGETQGVMCGVCGMWKVRGIVSNRHDYFYDIEVWKKLVPAWEKANGREWLPPMPQLPVKI